MTNDKMRPIGEVPFPSQCWLIKYNNQKRWSSVREDTVIWELKREFGDDWERMFHNAKFGFMGAYTKYAHYMFLPDSAYQDELENC